MSARRGYAICTSPRSGSTFLCRLLASTGKLGNPREYFNAPARRADTDPLYPDDPVAQIDRLLTSATPNGVYGLKIFAYQHALVRRRVRWTEVLPGLRFIYLERRDLLGQAISHLRTEQTGRYLLSEPEKRAPNYSAAEIRRAIAFVLEERKFWSVFFAAKGILPEYVVYEDLVEDPQSTVDRIAALLGVETAVIRPELVDVQILRDPLSEEWRQRFISEHAWLAGRD